MKCPGAPESEKKNWVPAKVYDLLVKNTPVVTVDAVIVRDSQVVLIRRSIPPLVGYWHLPGGLLRKGERLPACAKRKALEETGLTIKVIKLIGVYDDPSANPLRHDIAVTFLCRPISGKIRGSWQGDELGFFRLDGLPEALGFNVSEQLAAVKKMGKINR